MSVHYTQLSKEKTEARIPQRMISVASTLASLDLVSVSVWPTAEKSLSDCAELAEIQKMRRATYNI